MSSKHLEFFFVQMKRSQHPCTNQSCTLTPKTPTHTPGVYIALLTTENCLGEGYFSPALLLMESLWNPGYAS